MTEPRRVSGPKTFYIIRLADGTYANELGAHVKEKKHAKPFEFFTVAALFAYRTLQLSTRDFEVEVVHQAEMT